ncbi:MAG: S41 family peptidase [Spirochaetales bacterium]|nr:S41 family peptidase [Spirochaetales bacterium]
MKKFRAFHIFVFILIALTLAPVFAGGDPEPLITGLTSGRFAQDKISTDISALERLYRYIDAIYIEEVDKDKVFTDLATALVASLDDPYSFYVKPSDAKEYEEGTSGIYGGIGTYLSKPNPDSIDPDDPETYMITIVSPFPGSPAQRVGLRAGDLISHIDGEPVDALTSLESSRKLRGEPNTSVTITVYRMGTSFDLTLHRELITAPTVDSMLLERDLLYIQISEFSPQTGKQLLEHVRKYDLNEIKGIIIDERNNSGGAVDGAMQAANIFLDAGKTIVTIQGKRGSSRDQRYLSSNKAEVSEEIPIVVLTNGGSASSAEIFAAAMRDNNRATLVGEKTFGKGIVQDVFRFGEGFAQITTAHYYTPNGENIHKIGIEPDVFVESLVMSEEELEPFAELMEEKVVSSFIAAHPEPSDANIAAFVNANRERGIRDEVLAILLRNEYQAKIPYDERKLADPAFDPQLQAAIDVIRARR